MKGHPYIVASWDEPLGASPNLPQMSVPDLTKSWGTFDNGFNSGFYFTRTKSDGSKSPFLVPYWLAGGIAAGLGLLYRAIRRKS